MIRKKICFSCRHQNANESAFCNQCGAKLFSKNKPSSQLRILEGESTGSIYAINKSNNTIGRHSSNTIVIRDKQISTKHAEINFIEGRYWINDLNSKNGVIVNGREISGKACLFDGSLIKLGTSIIRFENQRTVKVKIND